MKIIFSRHAKRRVKLYKISEKWLESKITSKHLSIGLHTIIEDSPDHALPIKTIFHVYEKESVIVTSYPLKKGKGK